MENSSTALLAGWQPHRRRSGPKKPDSAASTTNPEKALFPCSGMLPLEVDIMDEKAPQTDPLQAPFEAALAEERRQWRAINDPDLGAADRVVAYARWRAAVKRLKDLAISPLGRN